MSQSKSKQIISTQKCTPFFHFRYARCVSDMYFDGRLNGAIDCESASYLTVDFPTLKLLET